jgi:hypothetical protein
MLVSKKKKERETKMSGRQGSESQKENLVSLR